MLHIRNITSITLSILKLIYMPSLKKKHLHRHITYQHRYQPS